MSVSLHIGTSLEAAGLPDEVKRQSSDVLHIVLDSLGINEVRSLTIQAHQKGVSDSGRTFVILVRTMTMEAQNALLKLFEEPPGNTDLYLVIPHESLLLPTLRSRFVLVHTDDAMGLEAITDAGVFMAMSYRERLEEIALRTKNKDNAWIQSVVSGVAQSLTPEFITKDSNLAYSIGLVESYAGIRGASRKMLLEELALSLPTAR